MKKLNVDDRVALYNLPPASDLNDVQGTILGIGWSLGDTNLVGYNGYIVLLDEPYLGNKAILITDACIKHIEEGVVE